MNCKVCPAQFDLLLFFDPSTIEPLPVCSEKCGRVFLEWKKGKRSKREKANKLRMMTMRPIKISVETGVEIMKERVPPVGPGGIGG